MLLNDLAEKVIGSAIRVHKKLGAGQLKSAYQECLHYVLNKAGLFVQKEKPIPVSFEGVKLERDYLINLLIERKFVVELKPVEHFNPVHYAQVLTSLELSVFKLGPLLNFKVPLIKKTQNKLLINKYPLSVLPYALR